MPQATRCEEYRQLLDAQRLIAKDIKSTGTDPSTRSVLAKTLVQIIDMKRTMRGIGKPKPVDREKRKKQSNVTIQPTE
jgi:hypothetical protein